MVKLTRELGDQIGEYKLDVKKQDQPLEVKIRAAPAAMSTPDRIKKDLEIVESVIEYLEKDEEGEKKGSEVIREMREKWTKEVEEKKDKEENTDKDQVELVSLIYFLCPREGDVTKRIRQQVRKTLDYNLHYLRFAFNTCYYCARTCQSPEALEAVCPRHVRRTGPALREFWTISKGGVAPKVRKSLTSLLLSCPQRQMFRSSLVSTRSSLYWAITTSST